MSSRQESRQEAVGRSEATLWSAALDAALFTQVPVLIFIPECGVDQWQTRSGVKPPHSELAAIGDGRIFNAQHDLGFYRRLYAGECYLRPVPFAEEEHAGTRQHASHGPLPVPACLLISLAHFTFITAGVTRPLMATLLGKLKRYLASTGAAVSSSTMLC